MRWSVLISVFFRSSFRPLCIETTSASPHIKAPPESTVSRWHPHSTSLLSQYKSSPSSYSYSSSSSSSRSTTRNSSTKASDKQHFSTESHTSSSDNPESHSSSIPESCLSICSVGNSGITGAGPRSGAHPEQQCRRNNRISLARFPPAVSLKIFGRSRISFSLYRRLIEFRGSEYHLEKNGWTNYQLEEKRVQQQVLIYEVEENLHRKIKSRQEILITIFIAVKGRCTSRA